MPVNRPTRNRPTRSSSLTTAAMIVSDIAGNLLSTVTYRVLDTAKEQTSALKRQSQELKRLSKRFSSSRNSLRAPVKTAELLELENDIEPFLKTYGQEYCPYFNEENKLEYQTVLYISDSFCKSPTYLYLVACYLGNIALARKLRNEHELDNEMVENYQKALIDCKIVSEEKIASFQKCMKETANRDIADIGQNYSSNNEENNNGNPSRRLSDISVSSTADINSNRLPE